MSNEIFEELWSEAARKDPNGQVGGNHVAIE